MRNTRVLAFTAVATTLLAACATAPTTGPMSFFITSAGSGKGADLGGLARAHDVAIERACDKGREVRGLRLRHRLDGAGQDLVGIGERGRGGGSLAGRDGERDDQCDEQGKAGTHGFSSGRGR